MYSRPDTYLLFLPLQFPGKVADEADGGRQLPFQQHKVCHVRRFQVQLHVLAHAALLAAVLRIGAGGGCAKAH